jgi:crotonobetainyl-CoA:carnitine CoA-transferase CaiB-like acyl-CoA transferase
MTEQTNDTKETAILEGIRVADLTTGSFNYAGRLLAGLGADVIKLEPTEGDPLRHWGPFRDDKKKHRDRWQTFTLGCWQTINRY